MEAFVVFTMSEGGTGAAVSETRRGLNAAVKVPAGRAGRRAALSPAGNGLKVLHDWCLGGRQGPGLDPSRAKQRAEAAPGPAQALTAVSAQLRVPSCETEGQAHRQKGIK